MENQEIDKQLKSQNLKGKIALILGIVSLILVSTPLILLFSGFYYKLEQQEGGTEFEILWDEISLSGTGFAAVAGIIFGFLGWKTKKGKIGIMLCIISLFVLGFTVWFFLKLMSCCY